MMRSGWFGRRRADSALVLGVVAGLLASLSGVVGYAAVPLASRTSPSALEVTYEILVSFATSSASYHAVVLFAVPFVATLAAVLVARHWHLSGWETDAKIVGSVLFLPTLTVFTMLAVAILAIGVVDGLVFAGFALMFGFAITLVIGLIVAGVTSVGALCGYALARGLSRAASL